MSWPLAVTIVGVAWAFAAMWFGFAIIAVKSKDG